MDAGLVVTVVGWLGWIAWVRALALSRRLRDRERAVAEREGRVAVLEARVEERAAKAASVLLGAERVAAMMVRAWRG